MTYDTDGILTDADSTPSVSVRKNGASVADSVTVTKRAATTGIYDCTHDPSSEVEGDCFSYEETATLSAQDYVNPWVLEVEAAERGTDGANTAAPVDVSANVAAILADTDELQLNQGDWATAVGFNTVAPDNAGITANANALTAIDTIVDAVLLDTSDLAANQGDWLTATGFSTFDAASDTVVASNMRGTDNALLSSSAPANWSTLVVGTGGDAGKVTTSNPASGGGSAHTAADVADLILTTPANKLTTDVSGNVEANNMRGTDGANTVAPVDVSANVALILADTSDLQSNQGQWLTATGFSTFDSSTDAVITDTASRLASKADVAGLSTFDPSSDSVAHVTLVDTTTDLTNGGGSGGGATAQEVVDAWGNQAQNAYVTPGTLGYYLDAQVSSAGAGGSGLYQVTVRAQDSSSNSLQGARINVDGTTLTLVTDTSGNATFNLDSGIYLLTMSPPTGYDTPTSQVVTVTAADPADTVFTLAETSPPSGCSPPYIG